MIFDKISNCPEDLNVSRKGIRNVPLDEAALEVFGKRADKACFHTYNNIHLAYRDVPETLGPVAIQRDALFIEHMVGFGGNPSEWMRTGAPGLNPAPAEMVGECLCRLAAAGVPETNEKDVDRFTFWGMVRLSHWARSWKLEIGNSHLETRNQKLETRNSEFAPRGVPRSTSSF